MKLKNTLALALLGSSLTFGTMTYAADNSAEIAKLEKEVAALDVKITNNQNELQAYLPYEEAFKSVSIINNGFSKTEGSSYYSFNYSIKNDSNLRIYAFESQAFIGATTTTDNTNPPKKCQIGSFTATACYIESGESYNITESLKATSLRNIPVENLTSDAKILRVQYLLMKNNNKVAVIVSPNGSTNGNTLRTQISADEKTKAEKVARIGELKAQ